MQRAHFPLLLTAFLAICLCACEVETKILRTASVVDLEWRGDCQLYVSGGTGVMVTDPCGSREYEAHDLGVGVDSFASSFPAGGWVGSRMITPSQGPGELDHEDAVIHRVDPQWELREAVTLATENEDRLGRIVELQGGLAIAHHWQYVVHALRQEFGWRYDYEMGPSALIRIEEGEDGALTHTRTELAGGEPVYVRLIEEVTVWLAGVSLETPEALFNGYGRPYFAKVNRRGEIEEEWEFPDAQPRTLQDVLQFSVGLPILLMTEYQDEERRSFLVRLEGASDLVETELLTDDFITLARVSREGEYVGLALDHYGGGYSLQGFNIDGELLWEQHLTHAYLDYSITDDSGVLHYHGIQLDSLQELDANNWVAGGSTYYSYSGVDGLRNIYDQGSYMCLVKSRPDFAGEVEVFKDTLVRERISRYYFRDLLRDLWEIERQAE